MPTFFYQSRSVPDLRTIAGAETITADKWYQPIVQPVVRTVAAALIAAGMVSPVGPLRTVAPSDWNGFANDRVLVRPSRPQGAVTVEPPALRAVAPADWEGYANDRPLLIAPPRPLGYAVVEPPPLRAVTPADWTGHQPIRPLIVPPRPAGASVVAPPGLRSVTPADWQGVVGQPTRARRAPVADGTVLAPYVVTAPAETVTVDKWFALQPQPIRLRRPPCPAGSVAPVYVVPAPAVSAWMAAAPQPGPRRPSLSSFPAGGQFAVQPAAAPSTFVFRLVNGGLVNTGLVNGGLVSPT